VRSTKLKDLDIDELFDQAKDVGVGAALNLTQKALICTQKIEFLHQ
jgi:hypothetical protein